MTDQAPTPYKTLNESMKIAALTSEEGDILFIHSEPLASEIQWIEFDPSQNSFAFIHEDGLPQELGLELDEQTKKNVLNAMEVTLVLVNEKNEPISTHETTIVIREY